MDHKNKNDDNSSIPNDVPKTFNIYNFGDDYEQEIALFDIYYPKKLRESR